jgi:hypothetical protein
VPLLSFVPMLEGPRAVLAGQWQRNSIAFEALQRRRRLLGRGEFGLSCVIRREHEKTVVSGGEPSTTVSHVEGPRSCASATTPS